LKSIIDYLEGWAATQPDTRLYGFLDIDGIEKDSYSYLSFHERTRNPAYYLARHSGLKNGARALLAYPPGLDVVIAFFCLCTARRDPGACVPADPHEL
jgi:acyl-CoA synthetase (AMP-forming)/AMP-acid ligase II